MVFMQQKIQEWRYAGAQAQPGEAVIRAVINHQLVTSITYTAPQQR